MIKVCEKLLTVQTKLNAPKNRKNKFGGYTYRSCEDILEAVKPLLAEVKATIKLTDIMTQIGDRYYINAQAFFIDCEGDGAQICSEAYAREPDEKKGMDAAQITGTASSYARKYALNALLLIDDAKDPDSDEYKVEQDAKADKAKADSKPSKASKTDASVLDNYINDAQVKTLEMLLNRADITMDKFNKIFGLTIISELPADRYKEAVKNLETAIEIKEKGGKKNV